MQGGSPPSPLLDSVGSGLPLLDSMVSGLLLLDLVSGGLSLSLEAALLPLVVQRACKDGPSLTSLSSDSGHLVVDPVVAAAPPFLYTRPKAATRREGEHPSSTSSSVAATRHPPPFVWFSASSMRPEQQCSLEWRI